MRFGEKSLAEAEAIKAQAAKRAPGSQSGSPKPFALVLVRTS
jgi:hypothetical protein